MSAHGALPYQLLSQMVDADLLIGANKAHLQPSSIDLSLSDSCFLMPGSLLPRPGEAIETMIREHGGTAHSLDTPLRIGQVYLVRLNESVALPVELHASASNKSSSGRINLRGRLLADGVSSFDELPSGYHGQLWIELVPMSFSIRLHPGDCINQLRVFAGDPQLSRIEHRLLYAQEPLLREQNGSPIEVSPLHVGKGITMTIDLGTHAVVGWKAKPPHEHVLDTRTFTHNKEDFFEPIERPTDGRLLLQPGDFFILSTKEKILVPPSYSAQMIAYDGSKGEFRSHFAGFFDPGWGWNDDPAHRGTIAVLEVEAYAHPFFVRDGQPVCLMAYEHLVTHPQKIYGSEMNSNYHQQTGPRLAKWFAKS